MATIYPWPTTRAWQASRFEMRIIPNTRVFTGPYTPTVQVLDLLGERWQVSLDLTAGNDPAVGAAREAFFDRLKGPANWTSLYHQRFPVPRGTLRDGAAAVVKNASNVTVSVVNASAAAVTVNYGVPAATAAIAQLANTATVTTIAGRTLLAGDMVGLGSQLVRLMADAVADGSGFMPIEFQPRARVAMPVGTPVVWNQPTANFMLKADGVPVTWRPGMFELTTLELIEAF